VTGKYRLNRPTLAMVAVDGHHEAITIPADETLDLSGKKLNGERLMDVLWRGRPVMMFVADLKLATVVI
jgi:hypothetical protein